MRSFRFVAALVLVLLAAPAAAGAATVQFAYSKSDAGPSTRPYETSSFRVLGDEGPDDLRIAYTDGGALDVADPSRPVVVPTAPAGQIVTLCTAVDEHHVHCQGIGSAIGNRVDVDIDARGGDDRVRVAGPAGVHALLGGAGDDVLQGGPGDDRIDGGPGDDKIDGGAGDDVSTDSEGRDDQHGGAGGDWFVVGQDRLGDGETLDGGPGGNRLEVRGLLREPVEIDLATAQIRSPRGITALLAFHAAELSTWGGVLLGDDGPNALYAHEGVRADGRGGDDYLLAIGGPATLLGGAGDDELETAPGGHRYSPAPRSMLDGGPGDDRLHAPDAALVVCGTGRDIVSADALLRAADCESSPAWFGALGTVAVTGRVLRVSLDVPEAGCGLSVQAATTSDRPVSTPVRTRRGGSISLRLPLIRRRARLPATVRFRVRIARSCPPGRRPWRYARDGGDHPALDVRL
jgi:hypothetical protein